MTSQQNTSQIIEHFFRHEYARLMAHLLGKYGSEYFDLVEDSVQEALIKATKVWPFKGIPENPAGWFVRVSRNKVIDGIRKTQRGEQKHQAYADDTDFSYKSEPLTDDLLNDDLLNMMFACCHPTISAESQVILTLKVLSGFGNMEIAKALLKSSDAVAKAFTRAKTRLKQEKIIPTIPSDNELAGRLSIVLKILYLVFNEGYNATKGKSIINQDVCYEAMRLTKLLLDHPKLNREEVNALMALMCFQASRFDAREDELGNLLTLEFQDRTKWNCELIDQGAYYLHQASQEDHSGPYYLQARIAACHIIAKDFNATNWSQILKLYDQLLIVQPNKFTALNRVVAYGKVYGANNAIQELLLLKSNFPNHYLYQAIMASLLEQNGRMKEAGLAYTKAIPLTQNESEKKYLAKKLSVITSI